MEILHWISHAALTIQKQYHHVQMQKDIKRKCFYVSGVALPYSSLNACIKSLHQEFTISLGSNKLVSLSMPTSHTLFTIFSTQPKSMISSHNRSPAFSKSPLSVVARVRLPSSSPMASPMCPPPRTPTSTCSSGARTTATTTTISMRRSNSLPSPSTMRSPGATPRRVAPTALPPPPTTHLKAFVEAIPHHLLSQPQAGAATPPRLLSQLQAAATPPGLPLHPLPHQLRLAVARFPRLFLWVMMIFPHLYPLALASSPRGRRHPRQGVRTTTTRTSWTRMATMRTSLTPPVRPPHCKGERRPTLIEARRHPCPHCRPLAAPPPELLPEALHALVGTAAKVRGDPRRWELLGLGRGGAQG